MCESNSDILFLKKELEPIPVTLYLSYEDASGVEFYMQSNLKLFESDLA
jgi:hypothetical protein